LDWLSDEGLLQLFREASDYAYETAHEFRQRHLIAAMVKRSI
jgi:hypothetical protein